MMFREHILLLLLYHKCLQYFNQELHLKMIKQFRSDSVKNIPGNTLLTEATI